LHDLLICYLISPLLLKGINSIKKSLILFSLLSFIRIIYEEFITHGAYNLFDTNFHDSPVIRALEFYLGMLIIPSFLKIKIYFDQYQNKYIFKMFFTFIQITSTFITFLILNRFQNLYRCYFVMIFVLYIIKLAKYNCDIVFIIGYDYGYLSYIISNKFIQFIMNPQMEMYLSHISINSIITTNKFFYFLSYLDKKLIFIIKLIIIFSFGLLYKKLLKERLSKSLDKIVYLINKMIN
jgi:hypothetical protein